MDRLSMKKEIKNPLLLPSESLLDELFKVCVYLLSTVEQGYFIKPCKAPFEPLVIIPKSTRTECLHPDIERAIKEASPTLPAGWVMGEAARLSDRYVRADLPPALAESKFGIKRRIECLILLANEYADASFQQFKDEAFLISVFCIPSDGSFLSLSEIYAALAHECIHLYQAQMTKIKSSPYTGLPFEENKEFKENIKASEHIIKELFRSQGLNSSIVDVYYLEDSEFYTTLFDEIMRFIQQVSAKNDSLNSSLETEIYKFILNRPFFQNLYYIEPGKYNIAVSEFREAINTRLDELKQTFADKIIEPEKALNKK